MTSPLRNTFDNYSTQLAAYLRQREANTMRGEPERLRGLEMTTDLDLLKKYSWTVAIVAAVVSFFALPLLAAVLRPLFPQILSQIFWALIRISMGLSCALFGLAAYFTFWARNDAG